MRKALKLYIFVIVVVAISCKASVAKFERKDVRAEDFLIRDSLADVRYAKIVQILINLKMQKKTS
jgi:hypothetical protein